MKPLFLVLAFAAACSPHSPTEPRNIPVAPPVHPCDVDGIATDFWNCGACGVACDPTITDTCQNGVCRCGIANECALGEGCRFGDCIVAAPLGDVCEFDTDCAAGYLCISGHCTFYNCVPEECDGIDNDCDGVIDGNDTGPLTEWCMGDQAPPSVILPPCTPGFRVCNRGAWGDCVGDIPPQEEVGILACNLRDENCDGCIDGNVAPDGACYVDPPQAFDVVMIVDVSGSMRISVQNVVVAVNNFAANLSANPMFRFGIVVISQLGIYQGEPVKYLDLSDYPTFATALAALSLSGGGDEPQYDAVTELATGEMPMDWRAGSVRILAVFSDERGQSTDLRGLTESDMCASLSHGEVLAFFIDMSFQSFFDDCALLFPLGDAPDMQTDLETSVLIDPC